MEIRMSSKPTNESPRVDPTATTGSGELQVPWDLSEVVEPKTLNSWVREEIESLNWPNPALVEHLRAHPNYHPRMMLMVLTYAYASAVFESEEILRRCDADPLFRGMCTDAAPESLSALRKFRRDNKALLKWSLVQILKRCLAGPSEHQTVSFPAGVKRLLVENAVSRLDLARHMDRTMQEI
jgi:hypothetical protein